MKRKKREKKAKEQRPEIRDGRIKYLFRAVVFIVIAAFFFLGVYYATHYEDSHKIIKKMGTYREELNQETMNEKKAGSFAANFVTAYYSYPEEGDERYEKEVAKYLAEGVTLEAPTVMQSEVVTATPEKITKADEGYDVLVRATTRWKIPLSEKEQEELSEEEAEYKVETTTLMVLVPVGVKDDNIAIISTPVYVADTNIGKRVRALEDLDGDVEDVVEHDISNLVQNFLKIYYSKDSSQLKYFVTPEFGNTVVGGDVAFQEISKCNISARGNRYIADARYSVNVKGLIQEQRMVLEIVRKDKYYVDKITTRY